MFTKNIKKFTNNLLLSFIKIDTILAFIVSLLLYYLFEKNIYKALLFSVLFVIIFLVFLNISKHF